MITGSDELKEMSSQIVLQELWERLSMSWVCLPYFQFAINFFFFCLGIQLVIFLSVGMIDLRENKLHLDFQIGWPKYFPRVREVSFPLPPFLCQNWRLSWGVAFLWGTGTFPQTWLPGSDLFLWGLFFPWPSFFPNFIFLVPVYSWVYKAVGIVDRKGTWPNTYVDGWRFQSERLLGWAVACAKGQDPLPRAHSSPVSSPANSEWGQRPACVYF